MTGRITWEIFNVLYFMFNSRTLGDLLILDRALMSSRTVFPIWLYTRWFSLVRIYYEKQEKCKTMRPLHTYQKSQNPEHWQYQMLLKMWSNRNSYLLLVGMQTGPTTLEDCWVVFYKVNIFLSYNSTVMIVGIFPKELKTVHKTCTQKFLAALFVIVNTREARCLSVGEWIHCGTSSTAALKRS